MLKLRRTLDLMVLKAIHLGPVHGYDILSGRQQPSGDGLEIREGSRCPVLCRLERRGVIGSELVNQKTSASLQ